MKKCISYLACMSVVIAGLVASNSVDAGIFSSFKNSKSKAADKNTKQIDSGDVNKVDNKKHKLRFLLNKKNLADEKDRGAFDALQTIADTKIDKGLGKLLESRDKIDQEIMKKVGKLDVGQYRVVDMFLEELAANCLRAIDLANKTNDVNGKITCINYISKLYMFAQNKKWNEFKHWLTEFGNITFASSNLNSLKNNILSGINDLFRKYFSHNEMNASDIINVKSQPKILAIEDKKDDVGNTDPSVMLNDTIYDPVRKSHRHTFNDMKEYAKQMHSGDRNVQVQIGDYSNRNIDQEITLESFLNDGVENVDGPFTAEYVESPEVTYNTSDILDGKEQTAQVQTNVEKNVEVPSFVEVGKQANSGSLGEKLPTRNESSANDSVEGMDMKHRRKLLDEQLSRIRWANPTT